MNLKVVLQPSLGQTRPSEQGIMYQSTSSWMLTAGGRAVAGQQLTLGLGDLAERPLGL